MDLDELKRRTIANEWDDLLARYRTGAGNEIDPDRIRDLFKPEYDGTNVVAYHPYSSLLAKRLYAEALAALSGVPGRVLFVVGMPGAGKSRALRMGSDVRKEAFDIVYDGAFGSAEGLYREIDQALAAGVHPTVVYIHNTPARAFDNTLARVAKTGREVTLAYFLDAAAAQIGRLRILVARYGSRIMLHVVDNSERNEPRKVEVTKALGLTFVLDRAELLGILYENQILNVAQKLRIRRAAR